MQSSGQGSAKAPNFSQDFEKGIKIQRKYLPQQLADELKFRRQYDPLFTQQALDFQHQYDPALADEQLAAVGRRDPEWVATHRAFGDKVQQALDRGYVDPQRAAAYGALGKQVTGDTLRGSTASPSMLHDMTQAILSRSPNLSYGEAQNMAAAVYTGQRGQALQQQRQAATNQFLGQQSESDLALTAGGRYMSTPTITSMINQTPGVQAPRSFGYVNPNAGYQGAQYGLQNYQNQLAAGQQGGGGNPWMNALQGASSGASMGSIGGGYGAAGGAIVGGVLGGFGYPQYSDERLKQNISRTQLKTPDGIPVVEYDYQGKRWVGVIAQDVLKHRPDAVYNAPGGTYMVFYDKLGVELREIGEKQEKGVL